MKAKMSYKSKRIAIITAVIVLSIVAISTGVYFFIKGNDDIQATYTGNEQNIASTNNGKNETGENGVVENSEEQNQNEEDSKEPINVDENTGNNTTSGTTTNGNNDLETNNGQDDNEENIPNEEYTQVDIIETQVEKVEQEVEVGWTNISLANAQMFTNITTNKPDLSINKTATVVNSLNEADNAVQIGSKIRYDITVTNNSLNFDATGIKVSDIIPEGTKFDEEAGASNGVLPNESRRLVWVIDVPRKISDIDTKNTVKLSFTVEVVDTEIGEETVNEIRNIAVVNGKNTNETVNPIIETEKTILNAPEVLQEGSIIEYGIIVNNKSTEVAKTTIRDSVPEGTTLVRDENKNPAIYINGVIATENSYTITTDEITGREVITWNNVEIKEEEFVVSFKVTVDAFEGDSKTISNIAIVGDKPTDEVEEKAHNFYYKVEYYKDSIKPENKLFETKLVKELFGTNITDKIVAEDFGKDWINAKRPQEYNEGTVQDSNGNVEGYITINTENNVIKVLYVKEEVKELDLTIIPTTTETVPQRAVLVLDFSSSMKGDRIQQLKSAVNLFLKEFLKPDKNGKGTTGNEVIIIEYDGKLRRNPIGPSSNMNVLDISKHENGRGTNIDLGLTVAYKYINDNISTSVILMSDGEPYDYVDENGNLKNDSIERAKEEAKASAKKIKDAGIKLFTIGFKMNDGEELMQEMATSRDVCYSANDGHKLEEAFKQISATITEVNDQASIPYQTQNGIAEITSGFTKGQNVEIYTKTYVVNTTKPYKTYTWEQFIGLDYVTYNTGNGKLTFNLRDYINDNGISEDAPIAIRFVCDGIKSVSKFASNGIKRESIEPLQTFNSIQESDSVDEKIKEDMPETSDSIDENVKEKEELQEPNNVTDNIKDISEEEKEEIQEPNDVIGNIKDTSEEEKEEIEKPNDVADNIKDTSEEKKEEIQKPNDVSEIEDEEQQSSNITDTSVKEQESSENSTAVKDEETETVKNAKNTEKIKEKRTSLTTEKKEDISNIKK